MVDASAIIFVNDEAIQSLCSYRHGRKKSVVSAINQGIQFFLGTVAFGPSYI